MSTTSQSIECDYAFLVPLIFKAKGIKSGLWHVGTKMRFSAVNGAFGEPSNPLVQAVMPTALIGFEALMLTKVPEPGPLVFDAETGKETAPPQPIEHIPPPLTKPAKTRKPTKA